jgi:hypothetical protein
MGTTKAAQHGERGRYNDITITKHAMGQSLLNESNLRIKWRYAQNINVTFCLQLSNPHLDLHELGTFDK